MKYITFIFLVAIKSSVIAQEDKIIITDSVISWKTTINLTWSDFQGEVDANIFGKAKTSYKIDIIPENVQVDEQDRIQGYKKITVEARFYKKQSWTTVPVNDSIVLIHEQLHFNIAELFARKIRKHFKELQNNNEARFLVYSKVYDMYWKKSREYQKQFDLETNHGINLELNKVWFNKISKELKLLEEFK